MNQIYRLVTNLRGVDLRGLEVVRLNGREAQNYMDSILTEVFGSDVK